MLSSIFYDGAAASSFSALTGAVASDPDDGAPAGANMASSAAGVDKGISLFLAGDVAFVLCIVLV